MKRLLLALAGYAFYKWWNQPAEAEPATRPQAAPRKRASAANK